MHTNLWRHGLPLFQWGNFWEKEDPIGRGTFGLVFVARNGHGEKVVIKKLLSEDDVAYILKHFLIDFSASRDENCVNMVDITSNLLVSYGNK